MLLCRTGATSVVTDWASISEAVEADRDSTPCCPVCLSDHIIVATVNGRQRVLTIAQAVRLA